MCSTSRRPACIPPMAKRSSPRLQRLKAAGNSLFVVEHDLQMMRRADWLVDVGPAAGEAGGHVVYSGPPAGLANVEASQTRRHLFAHARARRRARRARRAAGCGSPASRATICMGSTSRFRSAASRPSRACRARASRASSARRCRNSSRAIWDASSRPADDDEQDPLLRQRERADRRPHRRRHGRDAPARARRSEADRPHAALESRHLHGPLRSRAQAVRRDARGAQAALQRRPLLVQRRARPLPDVRRRRLRQRRTAVPAERLCALLDLPRHALQRADARNHVARQEHRRGARPDRRRRLRFLRRRSAA